MRRIGTWVTRYVGSARVALQFDTYENDEKRVDRVRQAMLDALFENSKTADVVLRRRIQYSMDLSHLWYLRADVMAAVSKGCSEVKANQVMAELTSQFKGKLPSGMRSRPSPLQADAGPGTRKRS
jgi:hypothetical protein